jgi:hypothetical protein
MIAPPITVCAKPIILERTLLGFMTDHFFIRRITPAIKSNIPMARNIIVSTDVIAGSSKISMLIMFSNNRKIVPVKIRLVTIRKPPIARLSLTSFRIEFHSTGYKRRKLKRIILFVTNLTHLLV